MTGMHIGVLAAANSIHTVKIANGLIALGHRVTLFSLPNHRDADGALDPAVALVYLKHGGGKGYVLNAGELKKAASTVGIEVLNAHFASGYGTLAMLSGVRPYVMSVWGSDIYEFPEKSFLHRWLIRRNLAKAAAILSTSAVMAERTKRYTDKPVVVTPFGIDVKAFSPVAEPTHRDGIAIGIVKLLAAKYGIRELISAFDALIKQLPEKNIRLLIYGDGPQRHEMEQMTQQLRLSDKVTFFGYIPNAAVPNALHAMDIFCAPSTRNSESFGVAAVEAMACGVPCVTSDADGFTEVIANGESGFIVPKGDVGALTEKLAVLINDAALRKSMGEAGRQRVLRYYNWQDNIRTIADALTANGGKG